MVAAGFALWRAGRCVAAARWADVRRLRAYHRDADSESLFLGVDLADGTVMEMQEEAPGFDAFLDRASVTLPGMLPYAAWHSTLAATDADPSGVALFERGPRRA